jgi:hypothetical protein
MNSFEFAVKAQESQRARDKKKFPKPKSISVNIHDRLDNRIKFPPLMI